MKTTEYLYDLEPHRLAGLPYRSALRVKVESGRDLLSKLAVEKKDEARYIAAEKAIKFNLELLKELE